MRAAGLAFVVLVASAACAGEDGGVEEENSTRILALGDSYTIGEAVEERSRWPEQLAGRLEEAGSGPVAVEIVARTGWTTAELDAGIDAAAPVGPFDLVTLQIGVNDQYRGLPVDGYRAEFAGVLDRAIGFAGGDARRVIVVSIPDWGVTPFAESRDRSFV